MTVPDDLRAALDAEPAAATLFAELDATNRYAVLHRVVTAPSERARADRIARIATLEHRRERRETRPCIGAQIVLNQRLAEHGQAQGGGWVVRR